MVGFGFRVDGGEEMAQMRKRTFLYKYLQIKKIQGKCILRCQKGVCIFSPVYVGIEDGGSCWMSRSMASQLLLASCLEALKSLSDSQFDKLGRPVCIRSSVVGVIVSLLTKDSAKSTAVDVAVVVV